MRLLVSNPKPGTVNTQPKPESLALLGPGVVTFLPFFILGAPLLKPNSRTKGTLIVKGLLRNQDLSPQAFLFPRCR